jgi:hypothetical protein
LPLSSPFFFLIHLFCCSVAGSIPDKVTGLSSLPVPSNHTMALCATRPRTYISVWNLPEAIQTLSPRKTDNLTAICWPIA